MGAFKNWLERKETEFYHATTTGRGNEKLRSFTDRGIVPHSASGHGQGSGYYTFTGKKDAAHHAMGLTSPEPKFRVGDDSVSGTKHGGNPMVVIHKGVLNPRDYDFDHEVHSEYGLKFLAAYHDQINKALKGAPLDCDEFKVYEVYVDPGKLIVFWITDPYRPGFDPNKAQAWNDYIHFPLTGMKGNVAAAEEIGMILKSLLAQKPEIGALYKKMLRSVQKNASKTPNSVGRAWKYVGQDPIQPHDIKVRADNKWVSHPEYSALQPTA